MDISGGFESRSFLRICCFTYSTLNSVKIGSLTNRLILFCVEHPAQFSSSNFEEGEGEVEVEVEVEAVVVAVVVVVVIGNKELEEVVAAVDRE